MAHTRPSTTWSARAIAGRPLLKAITSLWVSCHSQRRKKSACASARPLASTKKIISAPVEVPIATKPAMMASDSQRRRKPRPRSSVAAEGEDCILSSNEILVHPERTPIRGLLATGPREEHDARRQQEKQAATNPHDQ